MSSSACCMSRHPPSPDGIAPRPAVSSPPKFKLSAKSQEFFPASWSSGSRLSKPEDAAAIQGIFEEDKSDLENERRKVISKKGSSTLSAVKTRLKKHLSKDSGITTSKRHSRSSVGTTEEEIERRAELRRIRHKRIQEELSSEGIYDDDAKSLSSVGAPTVSALQKRASWTPGDPLPLPALALPSSTPVDSPSTASNIPPVTLFNRKGPMLEALYYGLMSPQPTAAMAGADEFFANCSTTVVNSSTTRSRRHSSPAASSPEYEIPEPNVYRPTRKRSSLPQLPKAPTLQPQRLPSIVEPAKSSWRLSFSADNRGEHLRKLSQGTNIPVLLSPETLAGRPQPMRNWLHSQGLRSPSHGVAPSYEASNLECSASHSQTCTASQEFGGVDGVGDSTNILHLHEMGISQRLASKGLQSVCSSPHLSSIGSRTHQRGVSSISVISRSTHKSRGRYLQNTTDSLALSERIPEAWGNVLENGNTIPDGTSSFYPSANNSIQPSPQSSRFNLFALLSGSRSKADLTALRSRSTLTFDLVADNEPPPSTVMSSTIPQTPFSRSSIAIASASSSSLLLPFAEYHRRPTVDTNSTIVSETESFREREAELIVVRTRFAAAEASRSPRTPRSSKFREEFNFTTSISLEEPTPCKLSAFSRLAKLAARSFDGPFERRIGIPLTPMTPAFEPDELHHHSKHTKRPLSPVANPLEDGSVMGLWGNAVKRNADPKARDIASNLHIPGLKSGRGPRKNSSLEFRKKSHVSSSSKDKKKFALKGLGWGMGDDLGSESEKEENLEDDWEAELARVAQKAKGKSRAIIKQFTEPDRRYLASWSKFPSHDRHERTSSAKADDHIEVRDFATDGSEFVDSGKKTLREKIQKRLVAELDKQATTEVQNNTAGTFGRRSSMRPAGDLEYPELEVLPLHTVSLMSHEEIAEHVETVLKEEELDRKEEELDAIFGGPIKRKETIKEEVKAVGRKTMERMAPRRTGTSKSNKQMENIPEAPKAARKTSNKMETKSLAAPFTDAPVKKGPTARRGPVARKPGEQATPPKSKPAPKIAPAVGMPARGAATGGFIDGGTDYGDSDSIAAQVDDSQIDDGEISIADPRFYDDCIVNQTPGLEKYLFCDESELEEASPSMGSKKSKFKTWSGRDWDKYRHQDKNRRSLGTLMLRQSTDEVLCELERLEKVERENALRAAEEAWGGQ